MLGALFYHKVSPTELINMPYSEVKYWFGWYMKIKEIEARNNG